MRSILYPVPLVSLLFLASCGNDQAPSRKEGTTPAPATPMKTAVLNRYDFNVEPATLELSDRLHEVSGIAFDGEGRLFAHGDERGIVFELDRASGRIVRKFTLGKKGIKGDFEDIEIVGDRFYMVTGTGVIHEFSSGKDDEEVEYLTYETGLSAENDVEGMCYDPATNALLLACKADPGVSGAVRAVYSFSLATKSLAQAPRWTLKIADLTRDTDRGDFHPSAIARDPGTGHFLLMTSADNAIAELDSAGVVLGAIRIRRGEHRQPEGLAFDPDGALVISDEGANGVATVSIYKAKEGKKKKQGEADELEALEDRMVIPPPPVR